MTPQRGGRGHSLTPKISPLLSESLVLHRECCRCSPREIVVANAVFESADVMGQLFGERERLTHQTGHALPYHVLEALDVLGLPRWLRDRFLALLRDTPV